MAEKGLECNRHYSVLCHLQEAYKDLGYQVGDCPNAEYLASHYSAELFWTEIFCVSEEIKRKW